MQAFDYVRPDSMDAALAAGARPGARYVAGGTNLIDLLKGDVEAATLLVDVAGLGFGAIEPLPDGGLRIGAGVSNTACANDARVRQGWPLVSQALLSGAAPQLRNMATMGGNLLQRTRCPYFTDVGFARCNKRRPGSGCAARDGVHRNHAILGASAHCIATHPSDLCVALAALDATVQVRSAKGTRAIPFADFHRLPGDRPDLDTTLAPGELIVAIDLPPQGDAQHSHYLKLRDRASFAFALVSVAAALDMDGDTVRGARIALGGVAHKPWRATQAELALHGRRLDADTARAAARAELAAAVPLPDNAYKVAMAERALVRALISAGGVA